MEKFYVCRSKTSANPLKKIVRAGPPGRAFPLTRLLRRTIIALSLASDYFAKLVSDPLPGASVFCHGSLDVLCNTIIVGPRSKENSLDSDFLSPVGRDSKTDSYNFQSHELSTGCRAKPRKCSELIRANQRRIRRKVKKDQCKAQTIWKAPETHTRTYNFRGRAAACGSLANEDTLSLVSLLKKDCAYRAACFTRRRERDFSEASHHPT